MTLQELFNGVIYVGTLAVAITAIGVLLNFTIVRPLRGFLRREISEVLVGIKDSVEAGTATTQRLQEALEAHIADGHLHTKP